MVDGCRGKEPFDLSHHVDATQTQLKTQTRYGGIKNF